MENRWTRLPENERDRRVKAILRDLEVLGKTPHELILILKGMATQYEPELGADWARDLRQACADIAREAGL